MIDMICAYPPRLNNQPSETRSFHKRHHKSYNRLPKQEFKN